MPKPPKVTMRRRSDGTVRTYDAAYVKENAHKFKGWEEVPAKTKGPAVGAKPAKKGKAAAEADDEGADDDNSDDADAEEGNENTGSGDGADEGEKPTTGRGRGRGGRGKANKE